MLSGDSGAEHASSYPVRPLKRREPAVVSERMSGRHYIIVVFGTRRRCEAAHGGCAKWTSNVRCSRVSGAGSPVGAGLANGRGSLTVANTTFGGAAVPCIAQTTLGCGNQAQASGGGIYQSVDLDTSKVFTIASSTFQNNISTQGNGAGLITSSQAAGSYATKSITDCTFTTNDAHGTSVILTAGNDAVSIEDCTFSGNLGTHLSKTVSCELTLSDSTITGGVTDFQQVIARPVLRLNPYATPGRMIRSIHPFRSAGGCPHQFGWTTTIPSA